MANRVKGARLAQVLSEILEDYSGEVGELTKEAVAAATKEGVKAVKSASKSTFDGTGRYAKGWTSQVETGRLSAQGVIYNKDVPGLPHLLEHGHAKRGGGRVQGRVHIKPIQDALEEAVNRELEVRL